jgi:hypothetical protein
MKREQFDKLVQDAVAATGGLMISKGAEYASDADRLINFKRNAEKQGTTPLQIWKQYIGKHMDSIDTYVKRTQDQAVKQAIMDIVNTRSLEEMQSMSTVALTDELRERIQRGMPDAMEFIDRQLSEPIEGRFHDVINYCFLGLALIEEMRSGPT